MGDTIDYYDVLNIPKHSTPDQIRQAYKVLVRKWHPDKHPSSSKKEAETKFKSIIQAYQALTGPACRTMSGIYNGVASGGGGKGKSSWQTHSAPLWQHRQKQQQQGANDGPTLPRSTSTRRSSSNGFFQSTPTTIGSPVTGAPGSTMFFRRKPPPIEKRLECTLEELFRGCKKEVRYTRDVVGMNGIIYKKEEVQTVRVKPGWKKGTKVTFEEKGDERPGSIPSDVVFLIAEKEHPYFRRSGNDLVLKVEVPLVNALTGWSFSFRFLNGEKTSFSFENEIITPGYEKVIKGEGMPLANEKGARGDLRIKFKIVFPKRLGEEQKWELKNVLKDCCS